MKIAIISDIHGNIEALTSVIADIEKEGCSKIFCLGDLVMAGPNPISTLNTIHEFMSNKNFHIIQGNTDKMLSVFSFDTYNEIMKVAPVMASAYLADSQLLSEEDKLFLANLPIDVVLPAPFTPTIKIIYGDLLLSIINSCSDGFKISVISEAKASFMLSGLIFLSNRFSLNLFIISVVALTPRSAEYNKSSKSLIASWLKFSFVNISFMPSLRLLEVFFRPIPSFSKKLLIFIPFLCFGVFGLFFFLY